MFLSILQVNNNNKYFYSILFQYNNKYIDIYIYITSNLKTAIKT